MQLIVVWLVNVVNLLPAQPRATAERDRRDSAGGFTLNGDMRSIGTNVRFDPVQLFEL
jgi:hypothetical protein